MYIPSKFRHWNISIPIYIICIHMFFVLYLFAFALIAVCQLPFFHYFHCTFRNLLNISSKNGFFPTWVLLLVLSCCHYHYLRFIPAPFVSTVLFFLLLLDPGIKWLVFMKLFFDFNRWFIGKHDHSIFNC